MATTTIEPEGDPTYLAFERARQYGVGTLQRNAARDTSRAQEDVQSGAASLGLQQQNGVDQNLASYRDRGFGQSGVEAQDEARIRNDIALKMGTLLSGYQRSTTDIGSNLAEALAQSQFQQQEEQLAARNRLVQANAAAGVGL